MAWGRGFSKGGYVAPHPVLNHDSALGHMWMGWGEVPPAIQSAAREEDREGSYYLIMGHRGTGVENQAWCLVRTREFWSEDDFISALKEMRTVLGSGFIGPRLYVHLWGRWRVVPV